MSRGDLDHIARIELPWRRGIPRTECGLTDRPGLNTDEVVAKAKREGQQRFALTTCMTCYSRLRYANLDRRGDLVQVIVREAQRVSYKDDERDQFAHELTAIAALIEAHRDEFDALVDGLGQTTSLDKRRKQRRA